MVPVSKMYDWLSERPWKGFIRTSEESTTSCQLCKKKVPPLSIHRCKVVGDIFSEVTPRLVKYSFNYPRFAARTGLWIYTKLGGK